MTGAAGPGSGRPARPEEGPRRRGPARSVGTPRVREANATGHEVATERRPNVRRALSHVGGKAVVHAPSPELEAALRRALNVSSDERATMVHVHGFHSYPARLHPGTARGAIEGWSAPGQSVLDPFCGSGTVLVEARLLGRQAIGNDANPLAVELAWLKARGSSPRERQALLGVVGVVVEDASERRRKRSGASRRYPEADVELFDPHVLLELDSIRVGIESVENKYLQRALRLVLSATLTKVSRRTSDSLHHTHTKRIAAGFASRFFAEKTRELVERLAAFDSRVPPQTPPVKLHVGDARRLHGIAPKSIDLVVSSPPYPGVYDYFDHHEMRLRWLGLPEQGLMDQEMGSRRQLSRLDADAALAIWRRDFSQVHTELARVLHPQGHVVWVIADSVVGRRALRADELTREIAESHGFEVEAMASQPRPYFHRHTATAFAQQPRQEHLIVLKRRIQQPTRRVVRPKTS